MNRTEIALEIAGSYRNQSEYQAVMAALNELEEGAAMSDMEHRADVAIEILVNTKTRAAIIEAINQYGDPIDWTGYTDREILEEIWRSDQESGELDNGMLAGVYRELIG